MTAYLPAELDSAPFVVGGIDNTLDQRMVLWRMAAEHAPTAEWVEFGCGSSTARLLSLLPATGRLHCFDSEQGLPEAWDRGGDVKPAGSYANTIKATDARIRRHIGWYADTLPNWTPRPLGLVHIDCDLYSSTAQALAGCTPHCANGAAFVFDELHGYPTYADHEWRALNEWLTANDWSVRWLGRGYYQAVGVLQC